MISYAFVNGTSEDLLATSPYVSLQEFMVESEISIHESISEFMDKMTEYVEESAINGEENEEKRLLLEAEGDNIFAKIGEKVIELGKRVVEFIKSCIDKITNLSFKSKKDIDKLELLCKEYPNLKDEIICSFNKGELDVSSARSLRELEATYEELCKMSKNASVTPGSMQDKWNKAVEKFEKAEKSPILTVGKAIASGISVYFAIRTFRGESLKVKNNEQEYLKKASEMNDMMSRTINDLKNTQTPEGKNYISDNMSKLEVTYRAQKYLAGEYTAAAGKSAKVIDKISNAIVSAVSKLSNENVVKDYHKNLDTNIEIQKKREDEAKERRKAEEDAKRKNNKKKKK